MLGRSEPVPMNVGDTQGGEFCGQHAAFHDFLEGDSALWREGRGAYADGAAALAAGDSGGVCPGPPSPTPTEEVGE